MLVEGSPTPSINNLKDMTMNNTLSKLTLSALLLSGVAGAALAQPATTATTEAGEHAAEAAEHSAKAEEHMDKAKEHTKKAHEHAKKAHKKHAEHEKKAK